jgi:hypothetical protein
MNEEWLEQIDDLLEEYRKNLHDAEAAVTVFGSVIRTLEIMRAIAIEGSPWKDD